MHSTRFTGLIAATHTPFAPDGSLNLAAVQRQAEHLLANGVSVAFIGGSTGECHSLTVQERLSLADRWLAVAKGSKLRVIVHVGSNCLADARALTEQAQKLGAVAIAALAPSYFKPPTVDALVACCARLASAAPALPFYFYDIPSMTGVNLPMPEFLERGAVGIPNLVGLKFTNNDLMSLQLCREAHGGRFDILWGVDEMLLAALTFGVQGAVGSTYNFAAPLYHRLIEAFARNDLQAAASEQLRSVKLVRILCQRGYMPSAKAMMEMLGVDVGPPRLPFQPLTPQAAADLRQELEQGELIH